MLCCILPIVIHFMNSGKVVGYVDRVNGGICYVECLKSVPIESQTRICSKCSTFRENVLRSRLARHVKEKNSCQSVDTSSHK